MVSSASTTGKSLEPQTPTSLAATHGRFVAFWETMVLSVFPFTFVPELLVITGDETESSRRNLSKASKRYFYRLIFFYLFSVLTIGCICPLNASALTNCDQGKNWLRTSLCHPPTHLSNAKT
jgi:amino acid permease